MANKFYPEYVLADNPVAYWRFEPSSPNLDEGPNANHIIQDMGGIHDARIAIAVCTPNDMSRVVNGLTSAIGGMLRDGMNDQVSLMPYENSPTTSFYLLSTDVEADVLAAIADLPNSTAPLDFIAFTETAKDLLALVDGDDAVKIMIVLSNENEATGVAQSTADNLLAEHPNWKLVAININTVPGNETGEDWVNEFGRDGGYYAAFPDEVAEAVIDAIKRLTTDPLRESFSEVEGHFGFEKSMAAFFNGDENYGYTEYDENLNPDSGKLTVEFFFKADQSSLSGTHTLLSYKGSDITSKGWYVKLEDGKLVSYVGALQLSDADNAVMHRLQSGNVEADRWYHAIVRAGIPGYNIVLNGVVQAASSGFQVGTGTETGVGMRFGAAFDYSERYKGELDEVSIYDDYVSSDRAFEHFVATRIGGVQVTQRRTSRATAYQGIQVAKEAGPGFGGATAWRLKNMQMTPSLDIPVRLVRYPGSKANTDTQVSTTSASMALAGVIDFNLIGLFLDTMFGKGTQTVLGSGAAQQRVYNPSPVTPTPHPDTLVIEHGSSLGAERYRYGVCSALTMRSAREEASMEGTMICQHDPNADRDITITPSGITVMPPRAASPKNVSYWISPDGTNWTKLLKVQTAEVAIGGLWGMDWHQNDDSPSWDQIVELMPDFTGSVTVDEGSEASAFMSDLVNSTLVYFGMKVTGRLLYAGTGVNDPSSQPYTNVLSTGGTIAAATYYVKYSYKNGAGETLLSPAAAVTTTGSTSRIAVNAGSLGENATGINVYLSTDGTTFVKHGTSSTATYIIGSTTTSGAAPSSNTSGTPPIRELLRVNLPMLVTAPDPGDKNNVWGQTFTLNIGDDESFGLASITLVNALATY